MKISRKFLEKLVMIIMIALIVYNVGSTLVLHKDKYFSNDYWDRFPQQTTIYFASQYATKNANWIPDEAGFAYAGGALITGTSPVLVIPDAPPLGKYLVGLSAIVFNNEHTIVALFGIGSLFLLYFLSFQIFHNKTLALLPLVLFSFEPIFKNQFIYTPLFDFFQLVFLLSYFYLINKAFFQKKYSLILFSVANILLGCFIATKFFASGATIVAATTIYALLLQDKKKIINYLLSLPLSVFILLLSYARVFAYNYSFKEFLGIQKWVFLYHQGQIMLPFSVWPLLMFNQWYVWFGDKPIISDPQWVIMWPLITILSFITMGLYLLKKVPRTKEIEIIMIWVVCYLAFLSFGQIFSRYFVILIPLLYIVSLYGVVCLIKKYLIPKLANKR